VDGSGNTNGVQALVERSGLLWAKNLPLGGGSNMVFVTARSAAGHVSTVSASVIRSSFTVTLNPLGTNQVNKSLVSVTGMVSAASAQVWVNEVEATVELDGTWRANDVPVNAAATAIFDVQIYATPPPGTSARPSSEADGSQVFEQAQPPRVVLVGYSGRVRFSGFSEACTPPSLNWQRDEQIAWSREAGGLLHDLETSDSFENPPSEDTRVLSPGEGAISSPWEQSAASIAVSGLQTCHRRRTSMDYRVETRLAIEPGGQQRIGETVVYLVRGRALEVAPPDAFADPPIFGNLVGGENRTGTIPVAPQAQQVNDMALMSTGETNADGSVWGWTLAQAAAGAPLKLKHAVTQVQQYNDHTLDLKVSVPTLRMFANGKDLSTNTPEFCVGQKITFTTNWSSMPAGVQSRTVHWTLDGNYVNDFDQFSFNTSTNYFVNTSLLTNETTSAWWVSGATNPIIYTARLAENLTLTNGAQAIVTAKGQFKMFRPSVVMLNPAVNGTPSNIWITPWNILHFGKVGLGLSGGPNNLSFEVQVLSPHFEGDAKITQICTLEGSGISAVTNVLDNENPYTNAFTHVLTNSINPFNGHTNNIIRVDDAPQNASVESFHLYASFVDYIMFAPMGSTNISVPLGNLSWSTSFGASHPSTNISPNIVSPPTNPNASEAWPTWSDVFSNPN